MKFIWNKWHKYEVYRNYEGQNNIWIELEALLAVLRYNAWPKYVSITTNTIQNTWSLTVWFNTHFPNISQTQTQISTMTHTKVDPKVYEKYYQVFIFETLQ